MLAMLDEAIADLRAATGRRALRPEPGRRPPMPVTDRRAAAAAADAQGSDRADAARGAAVRLARRARVAAGRRPGGARSRSAASLPADMAATTRTADAGAIERRARDRSRLSDRLTTPDDATWRRSARDSPTSAASSGCSRRSSRRDARARRQAARCGERARRRGRGQLDAARRLRLARDRWALRAPEFRHYWSVDQHAGRSARAAEAAARRHQGARRVDARRTRAPSMQHRRAHRRDDVDDRRRPRSCAPRTRCSSAPRSWPTAPRASGARRSLVGDMARAWDARRPPPAR